MLWTDIYSHKVYHTLVLFLAFKGIYLWKKEERGCFLVPVHFKCLTIRMNVLRSVFVLTCWHLSSVHNLESNTWLRTPWFPFSLWFPLTFVYPDLYVMSINIWPRSFLRIFSVHSFYTMTLITGRKFEIRIIWKNWNMVRTKGNILLCHDSEKIGNKGFCDLCQQLP